MVTNRATPSRSAYADRTVTHPPEWHWLVVCDVLLNNLSTGLFLAAAACDLIAPESFGRVCAWAYSLAFALLLGDLLCLVLDLGDPSRFHHMLRVFKPTSPMSLGTWSLSTFSAPLGLIVVLEFLILIGLVSSDSGWAYWAYRVALMVGVLPAFASASYKGVLFSTTAQPGWKDARWLGAYLANSAVMLGSAEMLVLSSLIGEARGTDALRVASGVLVMLNAIPFGLLLAEVGPTLSMVYPAARVRLISAALLVAGVIIPLLVLLIGREWLVSSAFLALLILTGAVIRSVLVWLPHHAIRA